MCNWGRRELGHIAGSTWGISEGSISGMGALFLLGQEAGNGAGGGRGEALTICRGR